MNNKNIIRMSIKHQCETCRMNFPNKANLQHHISNIHLKEKNFKCEHCDYICNQKINRSSCLLKDNLKISFMSALTKLLTKKIGEN